MLDLAKAYECVLQCDLLHALAHVIPTFFSCFILITHLLRPNTNDQGSIWFGMSLGVEIHLQS